MVGPPNKSRHLDLPKVSFEGLDCCSFPDACTVQAGDSTQQWFFFFHLYSPVDRALHGRHGSWNERVFFTTKEHLTKMCFYFLNLAVTSWNVLSQGIQTHILFPSWSSFWVLKNKFLRFSHRNTPLRGYCTPGHFLDCFCIFLKNYNTLVTSKICFL